MEGTKQVVETPAQTPPVSQVEPPKKNSCLKNFLIILIIIIVLGVLAPFGFIFLRGSDSPFWANITKKLDGTNTNTNSSTNSSTTYSGDWTLSMTSPISMTSIQTRLEGTGSAKATFTIPSKEGGTFTSTGNWTSEAHGVVGASNDSSNIDGKINLSGEIKDGKLHFNITYSEEKCTTVVSTPIGGITNTTCNPESVPDPHDITIDITDGAIVSQNIPKTGTNYSYNWLENWTLTRNK